MSTGRHGNRRQRPRRPGPDDRNQPELSEGRQNAGSRGSMLRAVLLWFDGGGEKPGITTGDGALAPPGGSAFSDWQEGARKGLICQYSVLSYWRIGLREGFPRWLPFRASEQRLPGGLLVSLTTPERLSPSSFRPERFPAGWIKAGLPGNWSGGKSACG